MTAEGVRHHYKSGSLQPTYLSYALSINDISKIGYISLAINKECRSTLVDNIQKKWCQESKNGEKTGKSTFWNKQTVLNI